MKREIVLYTKKNCPLCEEAKEMLHILCEKYHQSYQEADIYQDDNLLKAYQLMIPVVSIDGRAVLWGKFMFSELEAHFQSFCCH
ncbi:glutaredoxin [Scopulibacillus daqui]|uniref:Glutaredoxin n=1 Tax=Scopulibacillus daqui TaxID=1469162 RepID=A0ABS2PYG0_9BACL|nr:glutaredoxin family protein [Scopulibacillus daqui]MBM7644978.1 glutaredoxin [Scopulibacillus daqui]